PASLALCSGPVLLPTALIGLSILSLHDALPISAVSLLGPARVAGWLAHRQGCSSSRLLCWSRSRHLPLGRRRRRQVRSDEFSSRSEEHTSELQSRFDIVCRLLLENINECIMSAD